MTEITDELEQRIKLRDETIKVLLEERAKALQVIRRQSAFIDRLKHLIRDFRNESLDVG